MSHCREPAPCLTALALNAGHDPLALLTRLPPGDGADTIQ